MRSFSLSPSVQFPLGPSALQGDVSGLGRPGCESCMMWEGDAVGWEQLCLRVHAALTGSQALQLPSRRAGIDSAMKTRHSSFLSCLQGWYLEFSSGAICKEMRRIGSGYL